MGVVIFNGVPSSKYDIEVEFLPGYEIPERVYDMVPIPNRNGDLVIDRGTYKNVTRTYAISSASYSKNCKQIFNELSEWLTSTSNYVRLEDTYDPDIFRYAIFKGPLSLPNIWDHGTRTQIEFDCMPQKFLKSGEVKIDIKNDSTLVNPTRENAKPLIYISGSGSGEFFINDTKCELKEIGSQVILDCERLDAYDISDTGERTDKNGSVWIPDYPQLIGGTNKIHWTGGITGVKLIPRWWKT